MIRTLLFAAAIAAPAVSTAGGSWAFAPGAYTHSPQTGERVVQYAQHEPVEGLPDPRQTVSRYWRTRTNLRGADGSRDTIYEVRSFGNTLGGFDAQRERGFDAQLQTLDALTPFRHNPYLFFGGMQGFGYGTPGYPAAVPGTPVPAQHQGAAPGPAPYGARPGAPYAAPYAQPNSAPNSTPCNGPGCQPAAATGPAPGTPGTAWPYAPQGNVVIPPYPYGFPYGYGGPGLGPGYGHRGPGWGYGPGREGYVPGGGYDGRGGGYGRGR